MSVLMTPRPPDTRLAQSVPQSTVCPRCHTSDAGIKGRGKSPVSCTAVLLKAFHTVLYLVTSQEARAGWRLPNNFSDSGTFLPQHTHTRTASSRPGVRRRALGNAVAVRRQLRPALVHLTSKPVLPRISFGNITHLIGF